LQSEPVKEDFTIAVSFRHSARPEDFRCNHLNLRVGDLCVVDSEYGPAIGIVARARMRAKGRRCCKGNKLTNVIRKATRDDKESFKRILKKEEALSISARNKIDDLELKMKLGHVEVTYDEKRGIIYFTSEGRVDFRDMVKSIASEQKLRIEMRQTGIRDEAKLLGGSGICGCRLCCTTFLNDFEPVSIRMAKDQGLSLNPSKISGVCGRLMCCLNYENSFYKEMQKVVPRVGRTVMTPDGKGKVVNADYLRSRVTVNLDDSNRETFEASDVTFPIQQQKSKKDKSHNPHEDRPRDKKRNANKSRQNRETKKRNGNQTQGSDDNKPTINQDDK